MLYLVIKTGNPQNTFVFWGFFFGDSMKKYLFIFFLLFVSNVCGQDLKVVSLAPSITDEIIDLNCKDSLVGVTKFDLKKINASCVGDLQNIDLEKIATLKPDIVFVKKDCIYPERLKLIKKMRINVVVVPQDSNFEDICKNFILIGKILGKEDKAQEIIRLLRKCLNKDKAQCGSKIKAVFVVGARPIVAVGGKSYINEIMSLCCFENVYREIKKPYVVVSKESLIEKKPKVVFCAFTAGYCEYSKNNFFDFLVSSGIVGKENIITLDEDLFCRPTPYKYVESVLILKGIYEKFSK